MRFIINFTLLSLIILSFLLPGRSYAENDTFIKNYIGITSNRLCRTVPDDELKQLDNSCKYPFKDLYRSNEKIFEWSIFQKSAALQIQKNKCINQRLNAIMNDRALFDQWIGLLATAWAGRKKAQLILSKCEEIKLNTNERLGARLNPNFRPRINPNSKTLSENEKAELTWQELCGNEESMAALSAADKLFEYALPTVGGSDFFNFFEKNRDLLININTGKALTNSELLNAKMDPEDPLSFVRQDETRNGIRLRLNLGHQVKGKFTEIIEERNRANRKLISQKKNEIYDLDSTTENYMFNDNTVYQILTSSKQMDSPEFTDEDLNDIESFKKKLYNEPQLSMGAKCLLNHFEPSPGGELSEFALLSFGIAGLIAKIYRLTTLGNLGALSKTQLTTWGTLSANTILVLRKSLSICSSKLYEHTKLAEQNKDIQSHINEISSLPKQTSFSRFKFEIPMEKTPECKNLEKNFIVNDMGSPGCWTSLLFIAPLQISLPVEVISNAY